MHQESLSLSKIPLPYLILLLFFILCYCCGCALIIDPVMKMRAATHPTQYKPFVTAFIWHKSGNKFYYVECNKLFMYEIEKKWGLETWFSTFSGGYKSRWVLGPEEAAVIEFIEVDINGKKIAKKVLNKTNVKVDKKTNFRNMLLELLQTQSINIEDLQDTMPTLFEGILLRGQEKEIKINFPDLGKYVRYDFDRGGLIIYGSDGKELSFIPTGRAWIVIQGQKSYYYLGQKRVLFSPDLNWALIHTAETDTRTLGELEDFYLIRTDGKIKHPTLSR